jgi:hypothetical protein
MFRPHLLFSLTSSTRSSRICSQMRPELPLSSLYRSDLPEVSVDSTRCRVVPKSPHVDSQNLQSDGFLLVGGREP